MDWSDAQISGLHLVIGKEKAEKLLKGCKVHWVGSCQQVVNKIVSSSNKQCEKNIVFAHSIHNSQLEELN